MLSSLRAMAAAIDRLDVEGRGTVSETPAAVTAAALAADDVCELRPHLSSLGWHFTITDSAGEYAFDEGITPDYAPFLMIIDKPYPTSTVQIVTMCGFRSFLTSENSASIVEIASLHAAFETMSASFRPWGSATIFSPSAPTKSPRQLVIDHKVQPRTPNDIRVWLPRNPVDEALFADAVFQVFAGLSCNYLMRALAGEIKPDGCLLFKGPPSRELEPPRDGDIAYLGREGFNSLCEAASWVYENAHESTQRHGLFTAEFARAHYNKMAAAEAFMELLNVVLASSKLSYQLSLSDLTREAIKAQADLRKVIADDTAKLADSTRQVVGAVGAGLATSLGLIAAKIATTTPGWLLISVALVVSAYTVATIASGYIFMQIQRSMRDSWRARLYRFVPEHDYDVMVVQPAKRAEIMFTIAAYAGGFVALLAVLISIMVAIATF